MGGEFYFGIVASGSKATISKSDAAVDPDPEPTYDVVDVTDMLADTTNWKSASWGTALSFADGSVTADGGGYSLGGYNKETFKNTVFRFKYTRTRNVAGGWDGFNLGFEPDNVYWNVGGLYVDFNNDSAVLRCIGKDKSVVYQTTKGPSLTDGQTYDIEFGVIDVNEKTVKVLLKIDDTVYFEKELTHEDFVGGEFYFGIVASGSKSTISKPDAK